MQTSEYRHMSKRDKKTMTNPNSRRHVKRAMAGYARDVGESKDADQAEKLLAARREIGACLKKRQ